jgi:8-oxo-dGTP diphosphatase
VCCSSLKCWAQRLRWCEQLLLVQTSYRRGYGLPGGGLRRGETADQAAVHELQEELGLTVPSNWLQRPWTVTEHQAGGRNTVTLYSLPWPPAGQLIDQPPPLNPDQLEIVATAWMSREQALQHVLPGHLRRYLENHH